MNRFYRLALFGILVLVALAALSSAPTASRPLSANTDATAGDGLTVYLPMTTRNALRVTLEARWLRSLVIEPGTTGRLIALTNEGRFVSSSDRGATWRYLSLPEAASGAPLQYRGYLGMDYQHPTTLYLGARWAGLWRSLNGGETWEPVSSIQAGPVAVSLDNPSVLWAGVPVTSEILSPLLRSEDAGQNWQGAGSGINGEVVSPILEDPRQHSLLYVIAQGPRGGASLYRGSGGMWELLPTAPLGTPPSGGPGLGLALNGGTRALYVASNDGTLSVSYNAHALNRDDITWQTVIAFPQPYLPIPLATGTGPNQDALYVTLYDWFSGYGLTLRSDDGQNWTALPIPAP